MYKIDNEDGGFLKDLLLVLKWGIGNSIIFNYILLHVWTDFDEKRTTFNRYKLVDHNLLHDGVRLEVCKWHHQ